MATRFYFPDGLTPDVSPDFDGPGGALGYWSDTDEADRGVLASEKQSTAFATEAREVVSPGAYGQYKLVRQYISEPLEAQTLLDSGTVKCQLRTAESDADANMRNCLYVRIVSQDGETYRDAPVLSENYNVWEGYTSGTEFVLSTLTNHEFAPAGEYEYVSADFEIQAGDRIVVEVGFYLEDVTATGSIEFGDNSASDLPEDEVSTDQYCGWIEFSQTLTFVTTTTLKAVTGSGGIKFGGVGVIAHVRPVTAVVGSGGIAFAGDGVIVYAKPTTAVVGSGGIEWEGDGVITPIPPEIYAVVGTGGIKFGGKGVIAHTDPSAASSTATVITGSGGIAWGGAGVVAFVEPETTAVVGTGGIIWGEFRVPELTVVGIVYPEETTTAVVGSGGIEFGGTGVIAHTSPSVYAVPLPQVIADADIVWGGSGVVAFIHPMILDVIGEGGVLFGGGEAIDSDSFDTYALTGARGEPSIYSNFDFNSYAKYREKYYGAGAAGLYLLEGEDDAGDEIHPGLKIGPLNFGTNREKRLRIIRCGGETDDAQVKVHNGNGLASYHDVANGRADVSMKVEGRELYVEITDFTELSHLELVPLVLHKR